MLKGIGRLDRKAIDEILANTPPLRLGLVWRLRESEPGRGRRLPAQQALHQAHRPRPWCNLGICVFCARCAQDPEAAIERMEERMLEEAMSPARSN